MIVLAGAATALWTLKKLTEVERLTRKPATR